MECREAREHMADRTADGAAHGEGPELERHLATCGDCRDAAEEAGEGLGAVRRFTEAESRAPTPPADVGAVIAAARPRRAGRRRTPVVGTLVRAAVVALAVAGVAALLQTRVAVGDGQFRVSFALPGAAAAPAAAAVGDPVDASALEGAVDRAVERSVRPAFEDLASWLVENDRRRADDLHVLVTWLEERRLRDADALAAELARQRRGLESAQGMQRYMWEAVSGRPVDEIR